MSASPSNVAALLTPVGRGAVATIGVRGPAAFAWIERSFLPHGARPLTVKPGEIRVGRWGNTSGEEVVVGVVGEHAWEIHCHGGRAAAAAVLADLGSLGCEIVDWLTWIAEEACQAITLEARQTLAEAKTERAAGVLLDQLDGALERSLAQIDAQLANEAAGAKSLAVAHEYLLRLQERAPLGLHLSQPWNVVITGRPNVGKSSLANALVGYDRSLVYDRPGTTRDAVTVETAIAGWPVRLIDTAGLRDTTDPIESAGVGRAHASLESADLVVLVLDASEAVNCDDLALLAAHSTAICVLNKSDLVTDSELLQQRLDGAVTTSAKTGLGINELLAAIATRIVPRPPALGEAVPITHRQIAAIDAALLAIEQGDRLTARRAIASLCNASLC